MPTRVALHTPRPTRRLAARRLAALGATLAATMIGVGGTAPAQAAYPDKPVKMIVGSPPGAPSDITTRLIAERLGERWKQTITVENKPGAGNSLAAQQVAQSPADGLTLLVTPDTVITVNPLLYKKLKFDPNVELAPVATLASWSQVLVCNAGLKIDSVAQLIERAKTQRVNYASGGAGTPGHLSAEMFVAAAGIDMDHVPYKGPAPALQDVLGGQVDCGFLAGPTLLPHIQSGKLKALAVSSAQPSPALPGVPSITQALGKPGADATFNLLLMVPKATPPATVADIEAAVVEVMKRPDMRDKLKSSDLVARGASASDTAAMLKAESPRWAAVVNNKIYKEENIHLDTPRYVIRQGLSEVWRGGVGVRTVL